MGCTWSAIILTQAVKHQPWLVGIRGLQREPRAHSSHHYSTTRLVCWHGTGWDHGFMLLTSNCDNTICVPQQKSRFISFNCWVFVRLSLLQPQVSVCWLTGGLTRSSAAVAPTTQGPTCCSTLVNKFFCCCFFCRSLSNLWRRLWEEIVRWDLTVRKRQQ